MSQEYEKRRADKEFVTRGEFEREHRFVWWGFVLMFIGIVLSMLLAVATCCADSTFVPIEPPKPTVCQKVCPVCGNCVPVPRKSAGLITRFNGERISYYRCSNLNVLSDSLKSMKADFHITGCDSIVWGRYRTICRVDTTLGRMHEITYPEGRPGCAVLHFGRDTLTDTIYTDDPRCRRMDTIYPHPNLRARGLDSVYVLPHDSLVNCRQVPIDCPDHVQGCLVYHFKNVCDTIRVEPHWIYFLWRNGKRTDIREKP